MSVIVLQNHGVVLKVDIYIYMGVSKTRGKPQNGWFIMENHIKMDDLGGFTPIFGSTPISKHA